MRSKRRLSDVDFVRKRAMGYIELRSFKGKRNQRVARSEFRPEKLLHVIAVVGHNSVGDEAILTEIGISKSVPWGEGRLKRRRARPLVRVSLSPNVRDRLIELIRLISWYRMRGRQNPGCGRYNFMRRRNTFCGIRFSFDPQDEELVSWINWHQAYRNPNVRQFIEYRAHGIRRRLDEVLRSKGKGVERGGKLTKNARWLLNFFERSRSLCNPYIMCALLETSRLKMKGPLVSHPLVEFLITHGEGRGPGGTNIVHEDFFKIANHRMDPHSLPQLDIAFRFSRLSDKGYIVYEVCPTSSYFDRMGHKDDVPF